MRSGSIAPASLLAALLAFCFAAPASANILVNVDKNTQRMMVSVDGTTRYVWPISTGRAGYDTPNGTYTPFRMEADHFSKEWDDAPMPHSIFFTKIGHAIHGTDSEGKLGTPASHGCVRLSKANASTLYALVQQQGVLNTTVTLTGSSQIALARNPRRANAAIARRDPAQQDDQQYQNDQRYQNDRQYNSVGEPVQLTPQPQLLPGRRVAPQVVDDGYIYPADGSATGQRYPAPRPRTYDAQAYPQQQYDNDPSYTPQYAPPPGYYQQRQYFQPRGLFQN